MFCRLLILIGILWSLGAPSDSSASALHNPTIIASAKTDTSLKAALSAVIAGFNRQDRAAIRPLLSRSRIYIEIAPRPGAYLSSSQSLVVLENFFSDRTAVSVVFDFVSDDGMNGSASGTLTSRKAGRLQPLKLTLGFSRVNAGPWLVTRILLG